MGSKCSKSNNKAQRLKSSSLYASDKEKASDKGNSKMGLGNNNELDDTYSRLQDLLNQDPKNPNLNIEIALCLYKKSKFNDSFKYFERAIELGAELTFKSCIAIADLETQKSNYDSAIDYYKKALDFNPNEAEAHERLGELYNHKKNHKQSLKHLEEAVQLDPKNCEFGTNLGLMYLNMHLYEKAANSLLKVLENNPEFAKAHNNLGNAYRKIGRSKEAIQHYNLAIDHTPKRKFPIAHVNLATTYFYSGDTISALRHFEEALQVGSNIHKVMVTKGYHLLFKNSKTKGAIECILRQNFSEALSILLEIQKNDQDNLVINYYLGLTYSKLEDPKSANFFYKRVLE